MCEFEIRAATQDDQEKVIRLMGKIYPGDMAARYEWLYVNNPHGRALTWLAIERAGGEAVGCTSIFPRRVTIQGRERVGGIGGDCFIEPQFRRRGIATALHSASFAQMRQRGVDFMYGPPTANNLGALLKAGSRLVANYRRWVRPLTDRGAYLTAFSHAPTKAQERLAYVPMMVFGRLTRSDVNGLVLEEVGNFGEEFDLLFDRAVVQHGIACGRDRHYLTWRYLAAPARRQTPLAVRSGGELTGFIAIERSGDLAAVADLFCAPDPKLIDSILQLAIGHAAASGCSRIEISLLRESAPARRLRRHGFIGREERGFQVAVLDGDPQAGILINGESWHFTEADQDMDRVLVDLR